MLEDAETLFPRVGALSVVRPNGRDRSHHATGTAESAECPVG